MLVRLRPRTDGDGRRLDRGGRRHPARRPRQPARSHGSEPAPYYRRRTDRSSGPTCTPQYKALRATASASPSIDLTDARPRGEGRPARVRTYRRLGGTEENDGYERRQSAARRRRVRSRRVGADVAGRLPLPRPARSPETALSDGTKPPMRSISHLVRTAQAADDRLAVGSASDSSRRSRTSRRRDLRVQVRIGRPGRSRPRRASSAVADAPARGGEGDALPLRRLPRHSAPCGVGRALDGLRRARRGLARAARRLAAAYDDDARPAQPLGDRELTLGPLG